MRRQRVCRRLRLPAAMLALGALTLGLVACEPPVPDGRDLGVVVSSPPVAVQVGDQMTVAANVASHGTLAADGARIGYLVPEGVEVTAITGPAVQSCTPGEFNPALGLVSGTCELGTLAPGTTTAVEIRLLGTAPVQRSSACAGVVCRCRACTRQPPEHCVLPVRGSSSVVVGLLRSGARCSGRHLRGHGGAPLRRPGPRSVRVDVGAREPPPQLDDCRDPVRPDHHLQRQRRRHDQLQLAAPVRCRRRRSL